MPVSTEEQHFAEDRSEPLLGLENGVRTQTSLPSTSHRMGCTHISTTPQSNWPNISQISTFLSQHGSQDRGKEPEKLLFAELCIVHAETSVGSEHPGEKWQGQLPLGAACVGQGRVSSLSFCCPSHLVFATNPMVLTYCGEKAYSWFCA